MNELGGVLVGFVLTIFIFSYIIGDNPLYRLAVHLLIGVSAAYAVIVAVNTIFIPLGERLMANPTATENLLWIIPLILGFLLLLTSIRPVAWAGNSSVGTLIAVGAAVTLVGVVTGTIIPQITDVTPDNPISGFLTALFTACTLLYFQFTGRPNRDGEFTRSVWMRVTAGVGQLVLMIAFGALFAGALGTSLMLLVERLNHFMTELTIVLGTYLS